MLHHRVLLARFGVRKGRQIGARHVVEHERRSSMSICFSSHGAVQVCAHEIDTSFEQLFEFSERTLSELNAKFKERVVHWAVGDCDGWVF